MRRLGGDLHVEAMSLYKHVADKEAILDGILDLVVAEIDVPPPGSDWKTAMRSRAVSARQVWRRHPWAIGLFEGRGSPGATVLRYLDAIIAGLRAGGFSLEAAAHAFWVLDSYVYGHVMQEMRLRSEPHERGETSEGTLEHLQGDDYPHLTELATLQGTTSAFDLDTEFELGLDLILDALDAARTQGLLDRRHRSKRRQTS